MCLSAGLCPDPLSELTAFLRPPTWIEDTNKGGGMDEKQGMERKRREREEKRGGSLHLIAKCGCPSCRSCLIG